MTAIEKGKISPIFNGKCNFGRLRILGFISLPLGERLHLSLHGGTGLFLTLYPSATKEDIYTA